MYIVEPIAGGDGIGKELAEVGIRAIYAADVSA
jgi:hypothetical protein